MAANLLGLVSRANIGRLTLESVFRQDDGDSLRAKAERAGVTWLAILLKLVP